MDPDAAFVQMHSDVMNGRLDDAREHARNLLDWIHRCGFYPKGMNRESALMACEMVERLCSVLPTRRNISLASDELIQGACILTAENMHTADDCTMHDHEPE